MSARKEIRLPAHAAALARRYPGVRVECCWWQWEEEGQSGYTYRFEADTAELLLRHGLATLGKRYGSVELLAGGAPEITRGGSSESDSPAYVIHHLCDGDPDVGRGRTFLLKKTVNEAERIWKRISAPKRARESR